MTKLAVVQNPSVVLDKAKSIALAVELVSRAAGQGADLVVFTETFIPGYPAWIWRLKPGGDWGLSETLHQRLIDNAVILAATDLDPLYEVAREYEVTVVCGLEEMDDRFGRGTLYNTLVVIGPDGSLLNRHRKLMPTNPERMVWGMGDGSGLRVVETPAGRIGTLICWENYMPLARYSLYAQGVEVYVAPTYDSGDGWLGSLQHVAREGRCWVVGCGNLIRGSDFPEDFPGKEDLYPDPDEWVNPGDSVVIAPGGEIVAGPLRKQAGILFHDIDPGVTARAKRTLDVAGHYARPDVFSLHINRNEQLPVVFDQNPGQNTLRGDE